MREPGGEEHAGGGPAMWGRLLAGHDAPARGERTVELARREDFSVEQILSGELAGAADYLQDHDEWVVVLEGGAVLEVDGVAHEMARGDWCLLPARLPHRLVSTQPGTSWVAVRGPDARLPP